MLFFTTLKDPVTYPNDLSETATIATWWKKLKIDRQISANRTKDFLSCTHFFCKTSNSRLWSGQWTLAMLLSMRRSPTHLLIFDLLHIHRAIYCSKTVKQLLKWRYQSLCSSSIFFSEIEQVNCYDSSNSAKKLMEWYFSRLFYHLLLLTLKNWLAMWSELLFQHVRTRH